MVLPEILQPIIFTIGIAFAAASSLFIRTGEKGHKEKDGENK